ncbi:MAG: glycerol-3-phosphate 1-O-acyltransferase PlsY [Kordiimonadaceae bacterium]|jgi:acyl phosphate:glycerol-3-phosphate acyltransferase|nr:glycerol-3-phosphate 1-O-acyltransferase PlsY [Kordiimonadaceae bacterium]
MPEYALYYIFVAAFVGYLLGSIPFGLVLTRMAGLGDIRKIGSGNIGATNVLRTGNKFLALLTLLLDIGKGAIAVLIAEFLYPGLGIYAGSGTFLGHLYSIFLKFTGGKGVATFLGLMLALNPMVGLTSILSWLITAAIFRISSLSALVAAIASPIASLYLQQNKLAIVAILLCILIFIKHKDNIKRIINGDEPKIGKK